MIKFFDTLSGSLKSFDLPPGSEVKMYTCGPTVYDYAHIGNFRAFVFEDLLRRFLEFKGFKVKHVMNVTDVDDKTIAGALREGKKLDEFTQKYTDAFHEDLKKLNIFTPISGDDKNYSLVEPRATREIDEMQKLIKKLIEKGVAYESEGSVYYRVASFPLYGRLSKKKLDQNIQGVRVDGDEYEKEEGSDFVLWKKAKENEPFWDSPWGKGRPGWHIECSAMSMKYLGESFDIHAGGEDLIFPHHENEIAQSEAATGKKFVHYWLHCKFLLVNGEKMSKSKGNFYTLRDLLAKGYDPMAIRYALLCVHYRQPLNFTLDSLKEASEVIKKLDDCYYQCLSLVSLGSGVVSLGDKKAAFEKNETLIVQTLRVLLDKILQGLEDDLNISRVLATFVGEINAWRQAPGRDERDFWAALYFFELMDQLLGLDISATTTIPGEIIEILRQLIECRRRKDFAQADALRGHLFERGWMAMDGRPGEPSRVKKRQRVWDNAKN